MIAGFGAAARVGYARAMRSLLLGLALVLVATGRAPARADTGDRPPTDHLVWAGLGMAVPTYFTNVVLHEGSHALVAKMFGGEIVKFKVLPTTEKGRFYFGYTAYKGRLSRNQKTLFYLAPKLLDTIMLGGFTGLVLGGALPENHYGRLALTVLATGFWVDYSKDVVTFFVPTSDLNRTFALNGLDSFWKRLPWRLLNVAVSAAGAYVVWRGYDKVFEGDPNAAAKLVMPLLDLRF